MKKILYILLLLPFLSFSQSIKRSTLCSFGSTSANAGAYMSATFAQPASIGTLSDGANYLRQGFQQPIGCLGGTIYHTLNPVLCSGDSIVVGNSTYKTTGTYIDTLQTLLGCDSVITTYLSVTQPPNSGLPNPHFYCLADFINMQSFDLNQLLVNQDSNGVWYDGSSAISNIISTSSFVNGTYVYTYKVLGQSPCNDANTTTELTLYAMPVTQLTISAVSCHGFCDGEASVSVQNSANDVFIWSNASTDSVNNNLCADTYWVETTNDSHCSVIDTITITEPPALDIALSTKNLNCNAGTDGEIISNISGGVEPYTYLWSTNDTTAGVYNLSAGTYQLTVTDSNSCTIDTSIDLYEPTAIEITSAMIHVSCYANSDGGISTAATGGVAPYTYLWNGSGTTQNLLSIPAGNYSLEVTDDNGCVLIENFIVNQPLQLTANVEVTNATCEEKPDGSVSVVVEGGTQPYAYLWSNGYLDDYIEHLYAGNYWVKVSDNNGCELSDSMYVGFNDFEDCFFIPTAFTPNGDGIHDDWEIDGVDLFPDITVYVYNRWGQLLFESEGYHTRWDGTHNGNELPIASYYYLINLNDGREPFKGTITIKR